MKRKDFAGNVVVVGFFGSLATGCDYAVQTIKIIAAKNIVFGIRFGEPIVYKDFFSHPDFIIKKDNATYIRPIFFIPGRRYEIVTRINYLLNAATLALVVRILCVRTLKYFWFFEPYFMPDMLHIFRGFISIYDCVDYFAAFSKKARRWQEKMMHRPSFVFANSLPILMYLKKFRSDVKLVPLGFASDLFATKKTRQMSANTKNITVGFVGSMSDRIDFVLLEKVIKRLPSVHFVFVGSIEKDVFGTPGTVIHDIKRLTQFKTVQWVPGVAKHDVPDVISSFDIGLIPYRIDNDFNKYSFPMKSMEYFALGKPVIATDINTLAQYEKKNLIFIVHDAHQTIKAIKTIQDYGWNRIKQQQQLRIAQANSWEEKIRVIFSVIA